MSGYFYLFLKNLKSKNRMVPPVYGEFTVKEYTVMLDEAEASGGQGIAHQEEESPGGRPASPLPGDSFCLNHHLSANGLTALRPA